MRLNPRKQLELPAKQPPINPAAIKYAMSGEVIMVVVYLLSEGDGWSRLRVKYTDVAAA